MPIMPELSFIPLGLPCYTGNVRHFTIVPFILILASLLGACAPRTAHSPASGPELHTQAVQAPTLELIEGSHITRLDPLGVGATLGLALSVRLQNPNPFPIEIRGLDYRLFFTQRAAPWAREQSRLLLTPGSSQDLVLDVPVSLDEYPDLAQLMSALNEGAPLPFQFEGLMRVHAQGQSIDVRSGARLAGQAQPRQRLVPPILSLRTDVSRLTFLPPSMPVLQVVFTAENPGDVGYFLSGRDLTLFLDGVPFATTDLVLTAVPAKSRTYLELFFYPDTANLTPAARSRLRHLQAGRDMPFEVQGTLMLDVPGIEAHALALVQPFQGVFSQARE